MTYFFNAEIFLENYAAAINASGIPADEVLVSDVSAVKVLCMHDMKHLYTSTNLMLPILHVAKLVALLS